MTNDMKSAIDNNWIVGARIRGIYYGAVFNGTVVSERPCYGTDMEYDIRLDNNIFPHGNMEDPRDRILLRLDGMAHCDIELPVQVKAVDRDAEGLVREVRIAGQVAGHVHKWKGLFEARTDDGSRSVHKTKEEAVERIVSIYKGEF